MIGNRKDEFIKIPSVSNKHMNGNNNKQHFTNTYIVKYSKLRIGKLIKVTLHTQRYKLTLLSVEK